MQYTFIRDMRLSKLALGTAQLGMEYGIANTTGQPDEEKAQRIITTALDAGVNTFDTAPAYGESERVLGSCLGRKASELNVITKISALDMDSDDLPGFVRLSLADSAKRLNIECIPIVLLHRAADMEKCATTLAELRDEGLVKHVGVSTYTTEDVREFLSMDVYDVVEAPMNVFDTRLIETGLLEEMMGRDTIILARSIFLQGLFFLHDADLPENVCSARPHLRRLRELSQELNISIPELAVGFVRDTPGVSSLVIGVETLGQLSENITLMSTPELSDGTRERVLDSFRNMPEALINPSKWER